MLSDATISACGKYRYSLWRTWDPNLRVVNFIGLNPSTADVKSNDPTIHKCIRYAKFWGLGGIIMTNLYAYRSPYPSEMFASEADIIGPENAVHLLNANKRAEFSVAVWGDHGITNSRGDQVKSSLSNLYFLKVSASGQPRHVRFLKGDLSPIKF